MTMNYPHCDGEIEKALLAADAPPMEARSKLNHEDWLMPGIIAYRLGVGEPQIQKLIERGIKRNEPEFEKIGGRLFATIEAVRRLWT